MKQLPNNILTLINSIPLNVAVYRYVDSDFIFVYFNDLAEKTDKTKREELIGKRLMDIFPKVKEFGLYDMLLRVHNSGKAEELDLGFYEDDRVSGWRHNNVSRLDNGDVITIYSDMTEQKNFQEKSLLQAEKLQNLGLIIDNSINEVYIFSAKNLHFTYINNAAEKNIGYTLEEMKKLTPTDIKPDQTIDSFKEIIKPLLQKEKEFLYLEAIHERKDKSKYNVEARLQMMSINNENQIVAIVSDITNRKVIESQLKESEEKFRNIAENSLIGIFIYQEYYVYTNDEFSRITGYTTKELNHIKPWEIVEESYKENIKEVVKKRLKGNSFPKEYKDINIVTKSGQLKTVRVTTQTIKYQNKYAGMGSITDVTDIIKTKKQVQLLSQAVEQMDELVRITDKNGIITFVNDAFVAHTGYKHVELLGKDISMFKSGKHDETFYKELWDTILDGRTYRGVFINRKKDKSLYYGEETITPIVDEDQVIQYFIATSSDITERIRMEEELKKLAMIDTLTGIYNRRKIDEEIDIEISRVERYNGEFALLMLDIDNFKVINDTYGHDVGDYVLKEFTSVILSQIRESDRFGRWGGEEFIITLPELNEENATLFSEKLRKSIETHIFKDIKQITVSVGITIFKKGDTKKDILKRVDDALYKAKESGRNNVTFI